MGDIISSDHILITITKETFAFDERQECDLFRAAKRIFLLFERSCSRFVGVILLLQVVFSLFGSGLTVLESLWDLLF